MSGAEYLSSIFGTEKDKVNCPFYFKIGACRHGDKCERRHNKPTLSQTLLLVGLYTNPTVQGLDEKRASQEFIDFYEDIFDELNKYGEIEELNVCDNVCEHMIGNVYVKYRREEETDKALKALTGRFYGGKPLVAEFSPVTDFRESSCRQYEMHECTRGGHCNFMHLKPISRDLYKATFAHKSRRRQKERSRSRERKRSRSPKDSSRKHRSRSRERERKDKDDKKKRRTRSRSRERHHKESTTQQ